MTNPKKNHNSNPKCFSAIFKRLICGNNLPTHPDNDDDHHHTLKPIDDHDDHQLAKPGIVARLMGLDSIPDYKPRINSTESLFLRSKSLSSLHFFPDFNFKKDSTFHRRSATTSSGLNVHHLGSSISLKINDGVSEFSKMRMQSVEKQGKREKVGRVKFKEEERGRERNKSRDCEVKSNKNKYEEVYTNSSGKRLKKKKKNVGIEQQKCAVISQRGGTRKVKGVGSNVPISSKRKDGRKEENVHDHGIFESDLLSKSPVSVLDRHHYHDHQEDMDFSFPKEDEKQATSATTPGNRIKIQSEIAVKNDDKNSSTKNRRKKLENNYKLKKADEHETEMGEYFVELLGQICRLAEEHLRDPKWVATYNAHFDEEISLDCSAQILDFLLNELMHDLLLIQ